MGKIRLMALIAMTLSMTGCGGVMKDVKEGVEIFKDGVQAAKEGIQATKDGIQVAKEGIQAAKDGIQAGAQALKDGVGGAKMPNPIPGVLVPCTGSAK